WNKFAENTHCLWTGIELDNDTISDGKKLNPRTFLDQLGRWIKNSGNAPISIKFSYLYFPGHNSYEDYCKEMKEIISLLLTCQHRWRSLKIYVENFSVVQGLLDEMTNLDNAPKLRVFELEVEDMKNSNYPAWKALCTSLTLHPKSRLHSGYARLTGLELSNSPSTESIMWWIRQAPNLKTLDVFIRLKQPEHHQHSPLHVWKLDNLSKLYISASNGSDIGPLLAQLTFPVLTDIDVNVGATNSTIVEYLLCRSNPQVLKKLTFYCFRIRETSVLTYLKQTPSLVYLRVVPMTSMILDALTAGSGKHPICPDLEELNVSSLALLFNFKKLLDMVHSRSHDTR
ncbi:hypothetical protein DFH11DRAFT_1467337, partial [Phellopilus nigrolimitatus]